MKKVLLEIIAILFIVLFLYTGISKLMDYTVFKEQLTDSPVLAPVAPVIAWALPLVEFAVATLLFWQPWRLKGLWASFILMAVFTIYVVVLVTTSTDLPCSCGGVLEEMSWQQHIVFNSVFTALGGLGIWLYKRSFNRKEPVQTSMA